VGEQPEQEFAVAILHGQTSFFALPGYRY